MEIDKLRTQVLYDSLPEWKKFLFGWRASIRMSGVRGLFLFPRNYLYLKRSLTKSTENGKEANNS